MLGHVIVLVGDNRVPSSKPQAQSPTGKKKKRDETSEMRYNLLPAMSVYKTVITALYEGRDEKLVTSCCGRSFAFQCLIIMSSESHNTLFSQSALP